MIRAIPSIDAVLIPPPDGGWKKKRISSEKECWVVDRGDEVKTEGNRKLTKLRAINIGLAQPRYSLFL